MFTNSTLHFPDAVYRWTMYQVNPLLLSKSCVQANEVDWKFSGVHRESGSYMLFQKTYLPHSVWRASIYLHCPFCRSNVALCQLFPQVFCSTLLWKLATESVSRQILSDITEKEADCAKGSFIVHNSHKCTCNKGHHIMPLRSDHLCCTSGDPNKWFLSRAVTWF